MALNVFMVASTGNVEHSGGFTDSIRKLYGTGRQYDNSSFTKTLTFYMGWMHNQHVYLSIGT